MNNVSGLVKSATHRKMRAAQFDRAADHRQKTEENRHLDQHRQQPLIGLTLFFFQSSICFWVNFLLHRPCIFPSAPSFPARAPAFFSSTACSPPSTARTSRDQDRDHHNRPAVTHAWSRRAVQFIAETAAWRKTCRRPRTQSVTAAEIHHLVRVVVEAARRSAPACGIPSARRTKRSAGQTEELAVNVCAG
jgi:hypothetical protein